MINLIKADLYRLFESKAYKKCIYGAIGITVFVMFLAILTDSELWLMSFIGKDNIRRGFRVGLWQGADFNNHVINALGSGAGIYIIGIVLTSYFIISRFRSGILKNTVTYGYERWKIYVSQLLSLIIGVSILIVMSYFSILLITGITLKVGSIDIVLAIKSLMLYIIIVSATISIYTLLATLITNSEVISVIAIAEMMGLTMVGAMLSTRVNNFIPYSMIRALAQGPMEVEFLTYLVNAVCIIIVTTFIGILFFNKKEIK